MFLGLCRYLVKSLEILLRERHCWKRMDCEDLRPPVLVCGMKELDREAFRKIVKIPMLQVAKEHTNVALKLLKPMMLKMERLHALRSSSSDQNEEPEPPNSTQEFLLHPLAVRNWESLPIDELQRLGVNRTHFYMGEIELTYNNWRGDEVLKYVLPPDLGGLTAYSRIGHIVHVNLRDELLPYKRLIGDVMLDKVAGCRTVVHKATTINNVYRNFEMELICGQSEYHVRTKQNGCTFDFDFDKVYWNPRLSTEHERIVRMLNAGDIVYDIFAGVGPFSVLAAKKGCTVLANDLNPDSFKWLQHNAKINKCSTNLQAFNKDGFDFIKHVLKDDLRRRWSLPQAAVQPTTSVHAGHVHIIMNLPDMAVEFLTAFRGLFLDTDHFPDIFPLLHVYCFTKGENRKEIVAKIVQDQIGVSLDETALIIHFVRNVAPNKDMYRASFHLTQTMLTTPMIKAAGKAEEHKINATNRKRLWELYNDTTAPSVKEMK